MLSLRFNFKCQQNSASVWGEGRVSLASHEQDFKTSSLTLAGWHAYAIRKQAEAGGDSSGPKSTRGRIQVRVKIQNIQYQQSVDCSVCD